MQAELPGFSGTSDSLKELTEEVVGWADGLAPNRRPENTVVKMVEETSELLDAIVNQKGKEAVASELADCLILLVDLGDMYGINVVRAAQNKMCLNRERDWKADGGVIRRIKEPK